MKEAEREKTVHLLEEVSLNISAIEDEDVLENLSSQMLTLLERLDSEENDVLILRDITHIFCGKLILSKSQKLRPNILGLYQFFKQKKLVSALFERQIDEQFDLSPESVFIQKKSLRAHRLTVLEPTNCASQVITSLKQLVAFVPKTGGMDKNLGFALLDLEGNFLLLCKKSRHLFGLKNTEVKIWNLFDLIIPFSKQVLAKKFGREMFHEDRLLNSSRCFNYVIYSKTAMKKFYTILKRKKIETKDALDAKLETLHQSPSGRDLYNAYMTALTSCATIVTVRYTRAELNELNEQKMLFRKNQVLFEKDLVDKKVEVSPQKNLPAEQKEKGQNEGERENLTNKIIIGDFSEMPSDDFAGSCLNVVYIKTMILLKTRFSKSVPNFNYQKLKDEPSIFAFENYLRTKILGQDSNLAENESKAREEPANASPKDKDHVKSEAPNQKQDSKKVARIEQEVLEKTVG